MRTPAPMLLAAALAGCATPPISQGGPAEIVFAASDTIRIRWNPERTTERAMRSTARAFCGGREVEEVDAGEAAAAGLQAKTWRCEPFSGTGPGT